MSLFWIITITLVVLGILAFVVLQIPDEVQKKKKLKKEPPAPPPKDWEAIAGRLEKRVKSLEQALTEAQNGIKDKEKVSLEKDAQISSLKRQFEQEKIWREKEEANVQKEKKREIALENELRQTRETLNVQLSQKIRLEHETKELRDSKEHNSAEIRRLSTQNLDLGRRLESAEKENRELKAVNIELKKKKEDTEWVAKTDYKQLEGLLKKARFELELFKKQVPMPSWPKQVQPKDPRVEPELAKTAPVAPAQVAPAPMDIRSDAAQTPASQESEKTSL